MANFSKFEQYMMRVIVRKIEHPEWRLGQTYFNVLFWDDFDKEFADSIRGTELDPFHSNSVNAAFLEALLAHWSCG